MKKLFVSILALAAFAACQSDFNDDVNLDAPQFGGAVNHGQHTVYAEVGVENPTTKATYEGLKAVWEENDQIALLQEHADYGTTFSNVGVLNIKEGWGTNSASFNGEISVDATDPRVYHIAYPASAVSFVSSSSLNLVGDITYENNSPIAGYQLKAHGTYEYVYNSTLNITVPTTQSGKWEPYMYASTEEAVAANAIGAKTLTTLTGAIAIRAFEADGVTPKQLSSITITSSDAAIAGAFSGTATSKGSLGEVVGDETAWHTSFEESSAKSKALASLESKAQGLEPASTTVTKTMSLAFAGNEKSIVADNLLSIAADEKGNYTYYVNVAPATLAAGTLTIVAVDADGSALTRVVDKAVEVKASHRAGFTLTWESASLKGGTIETWYNDWNKGSQFQLAGNTLYVDNISIEGNIAADHVKAIGVRINGEFHESSAQSNTLAISPIIIPSMPSGAYTVQPVAQVEINGEVKWLEGGAVEKTITSIPTVTDYSVRTSYSSNGTVAKTNDINGDILKVKANLSDSYAAGLAGNKYSICYNDDAVLATQTLGSEYSTTLPASSWGQYVCYVKISLPNGYDVVSEKYTTSITGIPYKTIQFYNSSLDNITGAGWTLNGSYDMSNASTGKNYLCLYHHQNGSLKKDGFAVTPAFPVSQSTNVTCTIKHKFYHSIYQSDGVSYLGATSANNKTASSTVSTSMDSTNSPDDDDLTTSSIGITLTNTNKYISIDHNDPTTKKWGQSTTKYVVYSFAVNYTL